MTLNTSTAQETTTPILHHSIGRRLTLLLRILHIPLQDFQLMWERNFRGFNLGMPIFLPFDGEISFVTTGNQLVEHLTNRYFSFTQWNQLPTAFVRGRTAAILDMDMVGPSTDILVDLSRSFSHSVWMKAIPDGAERFGRYLYQQFLCH